MISILDKLPLPYHEEFLSKFHLAPHHDSHMHYLNSKIEDDIEDVIKAEIKALEKELLHEIDSLKVKK
jgi:hypothetical protein